MNWIWVRLGDIVEIYGRIGFRGYTKADLVDKGNGAITLSPSNIINGNISYDNCTYISWEKYYESPEIMVEEGDVILCKTASVGKVAQVVGLKCKATINPQLVVFKSVLCDVKYLDYVLKSPIAQKQFHDFTIGTSVPTFSQEKLSNTIIPLPPIAEQKRIVAKIEELMPFVDQYAAASTKLNTLNASFPEMMKKSILQEAVQGKLVPQDPNDEPASVLLEKIAEEKKRLIKEGKIKKQKPLPEITEDEIPFDIPESWEWVRFENTVDMLSGFAFKSSDFVQDGKYRLLRGINLGVGEVRWDDTVYVNSIPDKLSIYRLEKGDVLLGLDRPWISNGIRVDIYDGLENTYLVQRVLRIREIGALTSEYVALILRSSLLSAAVQGQTTGISVPHISPKQVGSIAVPVPPVEEQKRIVEKVKLLCTEIDSLRQ